VKRLVVVLALLAAAAIAALYWLLHSMSDPEGFGLPNIEPADASEYELWSRASGNRLGGGTFAAIDRQFRELLDLGNRSDDLRVERVR
jgi:hypothetical protein